jgi:hypothetical protein
VVLSIAFVGQSLRCAASAGLFLFFISISHSSALAAELTAGDADYPQNRFTSDGTPQGGSKIYGDVEGGMDGCRADAEGGQLGAGKEWQETIAGS